METRTGHKRGASAILKSVIIGNNQRLPPSTSLNLENKNAKNSNAEAFSGHPAMLPPDHPHTRQHLKEESGNTEHTRSSPKKSAEAPKKENLALGLHKRTKSSTSLKTLIEKENVKSPKKKAEKAEQKSIKKSKSSTSLSTLLSRPRSSKGTKKEERSQHDKENETPPDSAGIAPPIWAQFASQALPELPVTTKVPLNDRKNVHEETALYTPQAYSPSMQRTFDPSQPPTLSRRPEFKFRPKSECLGTSMSFNETLSGPRKSDHEKVKITEVNQGQEGQSRENRVRQPASDEQKPKQNPSSERKQYGDEPTNPGTIIEKCGSRVMSAVAAFNGKTKALPKEPANETTAIALDPNTIETAFETLLEARNVPQNTRDKMRSLDTSIKADFIKQDKTSSGSASSAESLALQSSRPGAGQRAKTDDGIRGHAEESRDVEVTGSPKKSRPRSRTFTFSKGDQSPSKKQKAQRPVSHKRNKSGDVTSSASSKSLTSTGTTQGLGFFGKANKPAAPEDFIKYLREVQKPQLVEVNKILKLRQLLRNETVGWVDAFISQDGMIALVQLLYRTIEVEWREEHEDSLLHETLRCLRALSTTSSALHQLSTIQSTLFPTVLRMLFDEERKGPSEFTTRTIIMTLLSTYLGASESSDLPTRARTLLSYLRDPSPPEKDQPPGFIASIYHPRPYRVWSKELNDVTKEVFWIFLHHMNVIPYPPPTASPPDPMSYTQRHFPREHPPVPAAPYIGGVEWDATAYLTAHLDLLNGLLASLPSKDERNALRQELKDSGFEKVMGASFRTCKEKFYGSVHAGLATWVAAAMEDEWAVREVREGPKRDEVKLQSPKKGAKRKDEPPKLEMPKLDLGGDGQGPVDGGWL